MMDFVVERERVATIKTWKVYTKKYNPIYIFITL